MKTVITVEPSCFLSSAIVADAILQVAVRGSRGLCIALWQEHEMKGRQDGGQGAKSTIRVKKVVDVEDHAARFKLLGIASLAGWKTVEDGGSVGFQVNSQKNAHPSSHFSVCWNLKLGARRSMFASWQERPIVIP